MTKHEPLFSRMSPGALRNYADTLRGESTGGILLAVGAVIAVIWANSPWASAYTAVQSFEIGPEVLHLNLSLGAWASDGLLAIFFFVIGLELKREIVDGELRHLGTAIVPVAAAIGGMIVPALIYLTFNVMADGGQPRGWAIPTATDIAFAVAILGIVGKSLPTALRAFLLTLAVVDDLLAIVIIAVGYSDGISLIWILAAVAAIVAFWLLVRRGVTAWYLLIPLGILAWALLHASGVHATIAGVALGMVVPTGGLAEHFEHVWRPVSAGFAVPVFALLVAGVPIDGGALAAAAGDPVAQGVIVGLVLGKPIGIVAATWLVCRFERVSLASSLKWVDVLGVGLLAGIGFTVSLLIAELAFRGAEAGEHATLSVLMASLISAALGAAVLGQRSRTRARAAVQAATKDE
ncbi:MAG: Na+/H+ antiporter NhaA [Beutenbergiaceae bacterium]